MRAVRVLVGGVVAGALALSVGVGQAGAAAKLPVVYNGIAGYAHVNPTASPPGSNDFSCKPTAAHPRPIVLVHGTFADMSDSWQAISPLLKNEGYCVFALNYGSYLGSATIGVDGVGDIPTSAGQLKTFVDKVLKATGASKVDMVGHSQGGMMPRYYLKNLGGASKVGTLVGLAPSNHGTTLDGLFTLANLLHAQAAVGVPCPACSQQDVGSKFITALNAGGDTQPGVHYTVIASRNDEVVTPYRSQFLSGPDVDNITLQSQCPLDQGEHLSAVYDHVAATDVLNALDPAHPRAISCSPVAPIAGG